MFKSFLDDLSTAFPDETIFAETKAKIDGPNMHDRFYKYTAPRIQELMNKDSGFFSDRNKFMKEIGVQKVWRTNLSEETRSKIWAHIQNMWSMSTMMNMLPPGMLSMIESTADQAAKDIQEGGELTEEVLMKSMQGMLSKLLNQPKLSQ